MLSQCIRCGECARVCSTGAIQPNSSVAGWEGLWTPTLIMRLGYCDYTCTSCGQVCPTEAITKLSLTDKQQAVVGIAFIDRYLCIPWAEGRDCIVCEEMCPVPQKAIRLEERLVVHNFGERVTVRLPRVRRPLCTGCGICEYQCPVNRRGSHPHLPDWRIGSLVGETKPFIRGSGTLLAASLPRSRRLCLLLLGRLLNDSNRPFDTSGDER